MRHDPPPLRDDTDRLAVDERIVAAVRAGELLDPGSAAGPVPQRLHLRIAAGRSRCCTWRHHAGHLDVVDLLLKRGLDVNTREKGDNTYAMHWAAAAGHPRRRQASRHLRR